MSDAAPGTRSRVRAWFGASDLRLLAGFTLGIWALFTLVSVVLGLGLNGTVDTLRRITFLAALYAMLSLALNVQWGYAGLFNLGVAGFMAIGVYTMAMLSAPVTGSPPGLGLPFPVGLVGGVLAAALIGAIASLPALRLRGDYLAIVTVAFSEIIRLTYRSPIFQEFVTPERLAVSLGGLDLGIAVPNAALGTGGPQGLNLPTNPLRMLFFENPESITSPPTAFGAFLFDTFGGLGIQPTVVLGWVYVVFLVAVMAVIYWLLVRMGRSPFGRVLKAIREDELVASSLGKDTRWFKIKVFAVGCGLMGLVAILWRLPGGYISTTMFQPIQTFYVFVAVIIGGAGSTTGSVIGGAVFASLLFEGPNFVRRVVTQLFEFGDAPNTFIQALAGLGNLDPGPLLAYAFQDVNVAALRLVLLGAVLIYLIQNRPEGLLGHRTETAASVDLSDRGADR